MKINEITIKINSTLQPLIFIYLNVIRLLSSMNLSTSHELCVKLINEVCKQMLEPTQRHLLEWHEKYLAKNDVTLRFRE